MQCIVPWFSRSFHHEFTESHGLHHGQKTSLVYNMMHDPRKGTPVLAGARPRLVSAGKSLSKQIRFKKIYRQRPRYVYKKICSRLLTEQLTVTHPSIHPSNPFLLRRLIVSERLGLGLSLSLSLGHHWSLNLYPDWIAVQQQTNKENLHTFLFHHSSITIAIKFRPVPSTISPRNSSVLRPFFFSFHRRSTASSSPPAVPSPPRLPSSS